MNYHFTIAPQGDFRIAVDSILARANQDRRIVVIRGKSAHALIFCETVELAKYVADAVAAGAGPNPSLCLVDIDLNHHTIRVNQECGDGSRKQMADFVLWVLQTFGPCRVFDEDSDAELTNLAATRPADLFQ